MFTPSQTLSQKLLTLSSNNDLEFEVEIIRRSRLIPHLLHKLTDNQQIINDYNELANLANILDLDYMEYLAYCLDDNNPSFVLPDSFLEFYPEFIQVVKYLLGYNQSLEYILNIDILKQASDYSDDFLRRQLSKSFASA